MAVNFGDVDKAESAANFCKLPLALYLEALNILEPHWHDDDAR